MYLVISVILLVCLLFFALKWYGLKSAARDIAKQVESLQQTNSNTGLRVNSADTDVLLLAQAVNNLYSQMLEQQAEYGRVMEGMRGNMANVSHDLRTPLTSVMGYLQLLQQPDISPEQQARYIQVAYRKAQNLHEMVNGLFELARLEARTYPLHPEVLDANALLAEELAVVYQALNSLTGGVQVNTHTGVLPIMADKLALSRVYGNLLNNIIKHGGTHVCISSARQNGQAVLQFKNRAPLLTQEDTARLFEQYYVADGNRTKKSSGLGLAITRQLVQQTGGSIQAALHEGELCISVQWPLCE